MSFLGQVTYPHHSDQMSQSLWYRSMLMGVQRQLCENLKGLPHLKEKYFNRSKCSIDPQIQIVRRSNNFGQMNDNCKVIRSETQLAECLREWSN